MILLDVSTISETERIHLDIPVIKKIVLQIEVGIMGICEIRPTSGTFP